MMPNLRGVFLLAASTLLSPSAASAQAQSMPSCTSAPDPSVTKCDMDIKDGYIVVRHGWLFERFRRNCGSGSGQPVIADDESVIWSH
jgi:hypothetical protein